MVKTVYSITQNGAIDKEGWREDNREQEVIAVYSKIGEEILKIEDPRKAYYEFCRQRYIRGISYEEFDQLVDLYQEKYGVSYYKMAFTNEGKRVLDLETHYRLTEERDELLKQR